MKEKDSLSLRYSDKELDEFKDLVLKKLEQAESDHKTLLESLNHNNSNGIEDTSPTFKPFEDGSEMISKEANAFLANRQERFIRDLKNALVRIENKTYGICRETGKLISKDRLKLVPHATLSIEAKNKRDSLKN